MGTHTNNGSQILRRIRNLSVHQLIALAVLIAGSACALVTTIWEFDGRVAWNSSLQNSCRNNLYQLGSSLREYAEDSSGESYPPLPNVSGTLMFTEEEMGHEIAVWNLLACPAPQRAIPENTYDDGYYVYTGYLLVTDEDVTSFAAAYATEIAGSGDFSGNLPGETSYYGDEIFRLRNGIERFTITDINNPSSGPNRSTIPLMWEWPDNHQSDWGGNVLYLDGHVEWVPYPGKFPMTETAITTLAALAGYEAPTAWNNTNEATTDYPYDAPSGPKITATRSRLNALSYDLRNFAWVSAGENFPPLSSEGGRLMMEAPSIYPAFTTDREAVNSHGPAPVQPPPFFDDQDFAYLGYMLPTESDFEAFADAYAAQIAAGGDFSESLDHPSSYGPQFFRLKNGVQRFLITDINSPATPALYDRFESQVPVLIEWPDNYADVSGGHVLYMDGHYAWHDYPGEFPMTETVINTLRAMADVPEKTSWNPVEPPEPEVSIDPYGFVGTCKRQISLVGLALREFEDYYADDEIFPPLSTESGRLMFDETIFTSNRLDPRHLFCPGATTDQSPPFLEDRYYLYPGYALLEDGDVTAFATAYAAELSASGDFSGDLVAPTSYGDKLLRLQSGVANEFIVAEGTPLHVIPTAHDIPVLIEWPGNHEGRTGGHVYFLDGHVEWIPYPGKFPMTEASIQELGTLAGWSPPTTWPKLNISLQENGFEQLTCYNNLSTVSLALRSYTNIDGDWNYPPLSPAANNLMFDDPDFFEFYLHDIRRMNCPGSAAVYHEAAATDHSYVYLGYTVFDQELLESFARAYNAAIAGTPDFSGDLQDGETPIYRLNGSVYWSHYQQSGIDPLPRIFGESDIPLVIEWPDNHGDIRGGFVLYMDGSRKWLDYPSTFPMTEEAMDILTALAGRDPIRPAAPPRESTRLEALSGG